ncbi:addiction module toxin RelE [Ferrovibrio sp.]|uniref:addiction module toxin RelE n=1 Tax=Ferrovibrio sp. TaxID=1917215 RepID=UPI0025B90AA2|nr:addiction module toxin RelE [Ferrovibrio sp.]
MIARTYIGLVETAQFLADAKKLIGETEIVSLKSFLALHPDAGDVIPGTGGLRKLRWGIGQRGKRGGARVIYYYHDQRMPLILLAVYAKSSKVDLSAPEKKAAARMVAQLVEHYLKR